MRAWHDPQNIQLINALQVGRCPPDETDALQTCWTVL